MTIAELKAKAYAKQAAIDACDGHLWIADYVSQIVGGTGSCVCEMCGERRDWKDAEGDGVFKYAAPKGKP